MKSVCIVDDDHHFLSLQRKILEHDEISVISFSEINLFYDYFHENSEELQEYDLIIMDRMFYRENIDTLHEEVASSLKSKECKHGSLFFNNMIFLWTASFVDIAEARKSGFDWVIDKDLLDIHELRSIARKIECKK